MRLMTLLPVLMPGLVFGQTSAPNSAPMPDLPKEPAKILAAAAPLYDFSSLKLKPWHLKASYQMYDEKSKPTEQGTYEYWWAAPDTYRGTWSRTGMVQTDWHVGGRDYHSGDGPPLEFFERKLQSDLIAPLPDAKNLDPENVGFQRQEQKFGAAKLPCVMVVPKLPSSGQLRDAPMGMFPTYCFDPHQPILRAYYAFGATSVVYNKLSRVQGLILPREVAIYDGERLVLKATVDSIEGISATVPELTPLADATGTKEVRHITVASGVAQGNLLKNVRPVYPQDAKEGRIQGTVILKATIGTDGRLHDLSVVDGPSASLVSASIWAVSQWQYRPYLLKGEPVEVETTINVVFKLG